MWFWFSIIALLFWSGSDLFSKIGCYDSNDKTSHLKMISAVGLVMGIHCAYEVFIGGVDLNLNVIIGYLPVSVLYILSMAIGYLGLRYIELSISSPICNSSGALVAIFTLISAGRSAVNNFQLTAIALVCIGVIGLGIAEGTENEELRSIRQKDGLQSYYKTPLAILIPIIYCLLDVLGTYADFKALNTIDESAANCAYELTFFIVGLIAFIYVAFVKKASFTIKKEAPKLIGACCETVGQFFYIFALADKEHIMLSAPIISSYCIASMLWSRIFLKEKLSWKHYLAIFVVVVGIVIIGVYDG